MTVAYSLSQVFPKDQLEDLVRKHTSISSIIVALGRRKAETGLYRALRLQIQDHGFDITHFTRKGRPKAGSVLYEGKRFGRLVAGERISKRSKSGNLQSYYKCKCDCGAEKEVSYSSLKGGTQSCGCIRSEACFKREARKAYSKFGAVISYYKSNASRRRQMTWELTDADFEAIVTVPCTYCGIEPEERLVNNRAFVFTGVDRIDSSIGYTKANCISCCKACNFAKNDLSVDDFKVWVKRAYKHLFLD